MAQEVTFTISFVDKFASVGRKLKSTVDKATQSVKKFDKSSERMTRGLQKMGRAAKKAGQNLGAFGKKMTLAVSAPIAAFGVIAIKAASDAEEMESKFGTVFGNMSDDMREWADNAARQMGRGSTLIRTQTANMGDFLKGLGFQGEAMGELSRKLVTLTQDIGSFKNASPEQVFAALQGAMVGNNESLKTLGISLLQTEVQARAFAMTGKRNAKLLTTQEKAAASYSLIVEKTADAQGDAAKTSGSFANQMLALTGALTDAKVVIGKELIPVVLPMVKGFAAFVKRVAAANPKMLKMGIIIAGVVAVLGPLFIFIGAVTAAIAAIGAPIALAIVAFGAFIGVLIAAWNYSEEIWESLKKFADLASRFTPLGIALNLIGEAVLFIWESFQKLDLDALTQKWNDFALSIGDEVMSFLGIGGEIQQTNDTSVKVDINVKDPGGAVESVKSKRTDTRTQNTGLQMAGGVS